MKRKSRLKLYLLLLLGLLLSFLVYRIFLFANGKEYFAVNAFNIRTIQQSVDNKSSFNFAVTGNIRNSLRIFTEKISPHIKENHASFLISTGDAVYDGAENKYRLLYHGLNRTGIPYVLGTGDNEVAAFGSERFYKHFGPYFFSFSAGNSYFIFLDTSGTSSWEWQMLWVKEELDKAEKSAHCFVIMDQSPLPPDPVITDRSYQSIDNDIRESLLELFSQKHVSAVFSNGEKPFFKKEYLGVPYFISGGGGGLILDKGEAYQFLLISVDATGVNIKSVKASTRFGPLRERIENIKLYLYSSLYMSLFNILLLIAILGLISLELYYKILQQEHLYRNFTLSDNEESTPCRIAMFTNNYLPFVGGVPLSIDRLYRGLKKLGNEVKIFCPTFPHSSNDKQNPDVFRCRTLGTTKRINFPIANIFSPELRKEFFKDDYSLVHVHHPYWLGSRGMKFARKKKIPLVFTYHTRLEHYTHYIPIPGTPLKNLAAHYIIRHFANKCDAIITPTVSTEEYLRNLGVSAIIETIPTGIEIDKYSSVSANEVQKLRDHYVTSGEKLLITVSRLAKEKNLDFLLDGIRMLKDRSTVPFKCLIIGEGPERRALQNRAETLKIAENIIFTGSLKPEEVIQHYLASDLFVFASTSETQGMVLVEAMAGACPVVAVRASGVYDVIKDGFNGYMVPENTGQWSAKVAELLDNTELLKKLSEASRGYAEVFSVDQITSRIADLYRNVIILKKSREVE